MRPSGTLDICSSTSGDEYQKMQKPPQVYNPFSLRHVLPILAAPQGK